eukprot:g2786.t1
MFRLCRQTLSRKIQTSLSAHARCVGIKYYGGRGRPDDPLNNPLKSKGFDFDDRRRPDDPINDGSFKETFSEKPNYSHRFEKLGEFNHGEQKPSSSSSQSSDRKTEEARGNESQSKRKRPGDFSVLQDDEAKVRILGYQSGGFRIHIGAVYDVTGSMVATNDLAFCWAVDSHEEITWDSLATLRALSPTPDLLIIGTGEQTQSLPEDLIQRLADECNLSVDISNTVNAIATFNFLGAQEGRQVAAAFVALRKSE